MKSIILVITIIIVLTLAIGASAQSTTFTYQGKLSDTNLPANGTYDFEFILIGGSPAVQMGPTIIRPGTIVTNGVFTVQLDFSTGANNPFFTGVDLVMQIGVKKPTDAGFTILSPNQPVTSAPYAIRSATSASSDLAADSQKLGGTVAAQYVLTVDPRMTDGRNPLAGSNNYIQNQNGFQQFANFAINGNGSAGVFDAVRQYNILGNRVLATDFNFNTFVGSGTGLSIAGGSNNTFTGSNAGIFTTTGSLNSFFGQNAGMNNTTGDHNSFVGANAGKTNTQGVENAFFGASAGSANTNGGQNSYFGFDAGLGSIGNGNSFFGDRTGLVNTANANSFFADQSGAANTTGFQNSFFGSAAGTQNTTGGQNSFFGSLSGLANTTGGNNSFFGNVAGSSNTTGLDNAFFGQASGNINTTGFANTYIGWDAGSRMKTGSGNTFIGQAAGNTLVNTGAENDNTLLGEQTGFASGVNASTAIGLNSVAMESHTINLGTANEKTVVWGQLQLNTIAGIGGTAVCLSNTGLVTACASSLRYKKDLSPFTGGIEMVKRFHPIYFTWKDSGKKDLGLGAEDVAKIDPLLVTYDASGQVQGVKYDRISIVLLNAIRQQQAQIEALSSQLRSEQETIAAFTKAICSRNKTLKVCKNKQ